MAKPPQPSPGSSPKRGSAIPLTPAELSEFEPGIREIVGSMAHQRHDSGISKEDLAALLRTAVWRYGHSYSPEKGSREAWMKRIATNIIRRELSGMRESSRRTLLHANIPDRRKDIEESDRAMDTEEMVRALLKKKGFDRLTPEERRAFFEVLGGATRKEVYEKLFGRAPNKTTVSRYFQKIARKVRDSRYRPQARRKPGN